MRTLVVVGAMVLVGTGACLAQPLGVGVKIPLQAFVFVGFSEHFALEAGLPLGVAAEGMAAVADVKLFFGSHEIILRVPDGISLLWRPFVGVGALARVRSQEELLIIEATFQGLVGVEVPISGTSFVAFAEGWLLAGGALPGVFALGVRYEF